MHCNAPVDLDQHGQLRLKKGMYSISAKSTKTAGCIIVMFSFVMSRCGAVFDAGKLAIWRNLLALPLLRSTHGAG